MDIESIVADCKNGDSDAFDVLYRTYSLPMLGVIRYYIHNQDIAKDILHDGFIVAFTSISSLKEGAKVEAWLTTIMKNLSLQYLRKEADHISVPITDMDISQELVEPTEEIDLSWEQLLSIINRLPVGYNKVFRLNVLEGLSHTEIANLLGISHSTSASQLHHAKALLRRMINEYRMEIGLFTMVIIISVSIYHLLFKVQPHNNIITPSNDKQIVADNDNIENPELTTDEINTTNKPTSTVSKQIAKLHQSSHHSNIYDINEVRVDTISERAQIIQTPQDSSIIDSMKIVTVPVIPDPLIANNDENMPIRSVKEKEWTLSLAYSGTTGDENTTHYIIPDIGDGEPDDYTEETKKVRQYMPITLGISISRNFSNHWNIESGLRYTYLRTDQTIENEFSITESVQEVHYLGIPLKVNYKIFNASRFSIYGQGGVVLDIPFKSTLSKKENLIYDPSPIITKTRLNVPVQWSVEGGMGVQYQLTLSISIYAEPSFRYYFNPGADINFIRQEKPFDITIPIGIRMTW